MEEMEKVEKKEKSPKMNKVDISLDNKVEDVISLDQEGKQLFFSEESFLELPEEAVRGLSPANKDRYLVVYGAVQFERLHAEDPIPKDIVIPGQFATARQRTYVGNKKPGREYSWQTPDRLREMSYQGYEVSKDQSLDTFGRSPTGVHRIGIQGQDELILMETSSENFQNRQRAISEKSRQRAASAEAVGAREIAAVGGIPYYPDKETKVEASRRNFTEISKE